MSIHAASVKLHVTSFVTNMAKTFLKKRHTL